MTRFTSFSQQRGLPLWALCLTVTLACGGNSSSSSNPDGTSAGGTGGSSGGSANASSGGATSAVGGATNDASGTGVGGSSGTAAGGDTSSGGSETNAGGASNGGTNASGGTTAGGSAGETSATGGTGGTDAGGSAGTGGSAGSGGTGPTGAIGTLGDACDPPGKLACAGNYQKLTLVCGGDGEWEVNQTCSGDQFCDTREGVTAGICQDPDPSCVDQEPGYRFCISDDVFECGADTLDSGLVEECSTVCLDGACNDDAPACPEDGLIANCNDDCGGRLNCESSDVCTTVHTVRVDSADGGVIRTPDRPGVPPDGGSGCAYCPDEVALVQLIMPLIEGLYYLEVEPPWFVRNPSCGTRAACATDNSNITLSTTDANAPPTNINVRAVGPGAACPTQ